MDKITKKRIAWNKGKTGKESFFFGKHLSDTTKKKIGLANSISLKGNIPWNKGKKGIQIAWNKGKKMIYPNMGRKKGSVPWNLGKKLPMISGEKHHNWNGGSTLKRQQIRKSIEYKLWVNAVFARDGYTCQKYNVRGGNLVAHHIRNFAEDKDLRFAIDNGITLSDKAHREFHKKYGFKNNTKEQLLEFLESDS